MAAHVGVRDSTERAATGASNSIARFGLPSARWIAAAGIRTSAGSRSCSAMGSSAARAPMPTCASWAPDSDHSWRTASEPGVFGQRERPWRLRTFQIASGRCAADRPACRDRGLSSGGRSRWAPPHDQEAAATGDIAGSSKHELHPEPPCVQSSWTTSLWRGRTASQPFATCMSCAVRTPAAPPRPRRRCGLFWRR
jgi:hypothetical protein